MKHKAITMITRVYRFYADGFRSMTVGRYLWAMILIKVAIMFLVLKLFFFPNVFGIVFLKKYTKNSKFSSRLRLLK